MATHSHPDFLCVLSSSLVLLALLFTPASSCKLTPNHYAKTCPKVLSLVKPIVRDAVARERRMGASLLRLHFHDCFVNGCDGSILLDDNAIPPRGEKTAPPNNNSVRGFEVVDAIKSALEHECPGVVSCADILAIAARDAVFVLGGPTWPVKLGRRDARNASFEDASNFLPGPDLNLTGLVENFKNVSLSITDLVALSGGHTIGISQCTNFREHIYNGTDIDPNFAALRQQTCPRQQPLGDSNQAALDVRTANVFDNNYYKNLLDRKGLLHSDQQLFNGFTRSLVQTYATNQAAFYKDFAQSMINMGDLQNKKGFALEIRRNCRRLN